MTNYPLQLTFKVLAIAQQLSVTDAQGNLVFYVKQKAFKLREAVTIFADAAQTQPLYTIEADRALDFSARYAIRGADGAPIATLQRQGMKSLWRTHFDLLVGDTPSLTITEENPWTQVLDGLLGEVPVLGMLTGYLFHPAYLASRPDATIVLRLQKQPALFEGRFTIEKRGALGEEEELPALLALMMVVLLERGRG